MKNISYEAKMCNLAKYVYAAVVILLIAKSSWAIRPNSSAQGNSCSKAFTSMDPVEIQLVNSFGEGVTILHAHDTKTLEKFYIVQLLNIETSEIEYRMFDSQGKREDRLDRRSFFERFRALFIPCISLGLLPATPQRDFIRTESGEYVVGYPWAYDIVPAKCELRDGGDLPLTISKERAPVMPTKTRNRIYGHLNSNFAHSHLSYYTFAQAPLHLVKNSKGKSFYLLVGTDKQGKSEVLLFTTRGIPATNTHLFHNSEFFIDEELFYKYKSPSYNYR